MTTSDVLDVEREGYGARANAEIRKCSAAAIQNHLDSSNPGLKALGHYLVIHDEKSTEAQIKSAIQSLREIVSSSHDPNARQITAAVLVESGNVAEGFELTDESSLPMLALQVQLLIGVHRLDLADNILTKMIAANDDSALTKLASAWTNLANGNFQESYLTFGDLQTLLTSQQAGKGPMAPENSPTLLNGMAITNMQRCLWTEAIEDLQRIVGDGGDGGTGTTDALVNLVAAYRYTRQDEEADRCAAKLCATAPKHPLALSYLRLDTAFERFNTHSAQKQQLL
eukprot:Lankesteria_metandrocarpae@DN2409_c0_g1_i2.p1